MIRIRDIGVVDAFHVCLDIARQARRLREAVNDRLPHLLPQQPYSIHIRRCFAGRQSEGRLVRKGVGFTHVVPGSGHCLRNIVRDAVTSAVAEGTGKATGNRAVTAVQEPGKNAGGIADHRQGRADVR